MKITVNGKQLDVGDALRTHIDDRLRPGLGKYFNDGKLDATVTLSREGPMFRADCTVHAGHDTYLNSQADAPDIYAAFDIAADKVEKQLRRFKRYLVTQHRRRQESNQEAWQAAAYVLAPQPEEDPDELDGEAYDVDHTPPVIVAETTLEIPELSVGEAVVRMDMADAPVIVFRNSKNGQFNVVYRRRDGHVGWVDPAHRPTGS